MGFPKTSYYWLSLGLGVNQEKEFFGFGEFYGTPSFFSLISVFAKIVQVPAN